MKGSIRKLFALIACVCAWYAIGWVLDSSASAKSDSTVPLPNLRGTEAVEYLKSRGEYQSLKDAIGSDGVSDLADPQAKISGSNGVANDNFGYSVAINGNTAVIGAPRVFDQTGPGKAHVYVRNAAGTWSLQQTLFASTSGRDGFGSSVQIQGDTVVVSAPWQAPGAPNLWRGAVYVFVRSSNIWTQQAVLTAVNTGNDGRFGTAMAFDGNTIVVGAKRIVTGSASTSYVFTRTGTTWTQVQELSSAPSTEFGQSVAVSGDLIAIGDPVGRGSVRIWTRSGTTWNAQNGLAPPVNDQALRYGAQVALSGNTLAVKANGEPSQFQPASVYVYVTNTGGESWIGQGRISPPDVDGFEEYFGDSLDLEGDTLIVGDPQELVNTPSGKGYIVEYRRQGQFWSRQRILTAADGVFADAFGVSVAVSGPTIIAGAWYDDVGSNSDQGSAYTFECSRSADQQVVANDGESGDWFGYAVAVSGNTVVVGAKQEEAPGGSESQGAAYVYTLSGGGWTLQQKLKPNPTLGGAEFGHSVDIDGNTIVVGAWMENVGGMDARGAVYVFARSGSTWTQQARLLAADGEFDDRFGRSVAIDGNSILAGASSDDSGANNSQGSAYVFFRNGSLWTQQAKLTAADGQAFDEFGNAVDISGDTALIAAYRSANTFKGNAYVFTRTGSTWTQQQKLSAADGVNSDEFGFAVTLDGDTAAIGAWKDDSGPFQDLGSVYIFTRTASTWTERTKLSATDPPPFTQFGSAISLDGETLIVGQRGQQNRAWIFTGSGATWSQANEVAENGAGVFQFGEAVSISGETVVSGGFGSTVNGNTTRGAAWVYYADCSSAPEGNGIRVNRKRCSNTPTPAVLGTVSDAQEPAANLTVAVHSIRPGLLLTNLANNNGTITANVGADCTSDLFPHLVALRVSDTNGGVSTFNFTLAVHEQRVADFDGDNISDLSVWRPSDANWYTLSSANNSFSVIKWGLSTDKPAPADYDGDGRIDVAIWREAPATQAAFYILNSSNLTVRIEQFGQTGDIPIAGDFDGDTRYDVSVYRGASQSTFFYRASANNPNGDVTYVQWGTTGDIPVPGNYGMDGITDIAVYRNGQWWIRHSSAQAVVVIPWGLANDTPVPADYDGDGKTDAAVFRNGQWWILESATENQQLRPWGIGSDKPAPADYDGDGSADVAVYRNGTWWIQPSSGGPFVTRTFGISGDIPVASAYVRGP